MVMITTGSNKQVNKHCYNNDDACLSLSTYFARLCGSATSTYEYHFAVVLCRYLYITVWHFDARINSTY